MTFNVNQGTDAAVRAAGVPAENINPDPLFDTPQAAVYLHSSEPTLERNRRLGAGPRWVKMGGIVRYRRSDLDAYIEQCTRQSGGSARRPRVVDTRAAMQIDKR
jgi:predicted DNA-binding transcriptional regulator AlpA